MHATLAWLYGILAIASVFITGGMYRIVRDRRAELSRPEPDILLLVAFYAGLHGFGGAIWWILRAWDAVVNHRLNTGSAPWLILAAALLYVVGKAGLVYASSLNSRPAVWRWFLAASVLWSVVVWADVYFRF